MIREYHRPETLEHAIDLLNRPQPLTIPLGGGTAISRSQGDFAVVDLQALGWDQIESAGNQLVIGAASKLSAIYHHPAVPEALKKAIRHECNPHLQNMATAAGTLVAANGRSPLLTLILAVNADLSFEPSRTTSPVEDWLVARNSIASKLIRSIAFELDCVLSIEVLGRSPVDRPHLIITAAQWPTGRIRVSVGGFGDRPVLAMDGSNPSDAEQAITRACSDGGDAWASAEYRQAAGVALVRRLLTDK